MANVSIIIPAYNQASFIAQAIDSALCQTHSDIEIVVVDDGSTDDTAQVVSTFLARGNVCLIRQANAGLPEARNRGLDAAEGEFVCFLDSDDYLAPAHIARLVEVLKNDPDIAFAYANVQMVNEMGSPCSTFSVGESRSVVSGDIFESLLVGGYFPPHAVLVRKRELDRCGGFDSTLGGHADYELWMRIASDGGRAEYVDERLAFYRVYDNSMSRDVEHMRATRIAALEKTARRRPERFAAGLSRIQELAADLHTANLWLKDRWQGVIRTIEAAADPCWSLQQHFSDARLVSGAAEQLALWDSTINDTFERAVFLHPPAALEIVIPTGRAGRLTTGFAIHPDAWTKIAGGVFVFSIDVDRNVAATALLNPETRQADRRWISASLDVPASADGQHVLRLETQAIGSSDFGWALFRDVKFIATE